MDAAGTLVAIALFWPSVSLLGHADYRTRDAAQKRLEAKLDAAIGAVKLGENSADAEIAHRCRRLVDLWWKHNAIKVVDRYLPEGKVSWPWSDMLTSYDAERLGSGWEWHQKVLKGYPHGPWGMPYASYSAATRLWVADRLANRLPVDELLRLLYEGQAAWCKYHGYTVPP